MWIPRQCGWGGWHDRRRRRKRRWKRIPCLFRQSRWRLFFRLRLVVLGGRRGRRRSGRSWTCEGSTAAASRNENETIPPVGYRVRLMICTKVKTLTIDVVYDTHRRWRMACLMMHTSVRVLSLTKEYEWCLMAHNFYNSQKRISTHFLTFYDIDSSRLYKYENIHL